MKIFMTVFSLIGITGIYLRQVRQIGVLGLIGYVLLGVGYLAIFGVQVVGVSSFQPLPSVSPAMSTTSSRWPPAAPRSAMSARCRSSSGRLRLHRRRPNLRHRPLPGQRPRPWAAVLLSVGAVATVATAQLPELTQRLFAIPVGVALIGLGFSLWRTTRTEHNDAAIGGHDLRGTSAVAE